MNENRMTSFATINQALCRGCGSCIDACPSGAIYMVNGIAKIDQSLCTSCGNCIETCPANAIEIREGEAVIQRPVADAPTNRSSFVPALKSAMSGLASALLPLVISKASSALSRNQSGDRNSQGFMQTSGSWRRAPGSRRQARQRRHRGGKF